MGPEAEMDTISETETATTAGTDGAPAPPPPPPVPQISFVERVRSFLRSLSERLARTTVADEAPEPAGLSLTMPGRRTILAVLVPLALILLLLHAMAAMALGDRAEAAAKPETLASDLLVQDLRPLVVRGDGRIVSVLDPEGRAASLRSGSPPSQLALPAAATLLAAEEDGRVVMTRLGSRTAVERALDSIGAHWRSHAWGPIAGLAESRILPIALQVDPLSIPASARPRRLGVYRPCRDCPEMVELGPGMDVLGPMLWQRSADSGSRRAVLTPGFRIARVPVTSAQWAACKCPQVVKKRDGTILINHPRDASRYLLWLTAMTGRTFRIPTSEEWEIAARASARLGGARQWGNGIGEWVCVPIVSGKFPLCDYARRGANGAVYDVAPASRARAALRLVEDIGLATPNRATPAGAASYEQAEQLRQRLVQEAAGEQAPAQQPPVQQAQSRQRPVQRRARQTQAQQPAQRPAQQTPPEQNLAY